MSTLVPSGKRILLIKPGPYVPGEKDNGKSRAVNAESRSLTREDRCPPGGSGLHSNTNDPIGGRTRFSGSALIRVHQQNLGEASHFGGTSF